MANIKPVHGVYSPASEQWVGDGFRVRNLFPGNPLGARISPFLLLDYIGPTEFPPSFEQRGVGEHPHRGFEPLTIVYQGEVEHWDSAGHHGMVGPGDVQWITAGSGLVHEERHSRAFTRNGGVLEAVQLWVNLPRAHKMVEPHYQTLLRSVIPGMEVPGGYVRVIAGSFRDGRGPAQTLTPLTLLDVRLRSGHKMDLHLPDGHCAALFVLRGPILVNGSNHVDAAQLAVLEGSGERVVFKAQADATVLVLSGQPIHEPVVTYGPFVMNTEQEIEEAVHDYQAGRMGHVHTVGYH
jgi:redox-sensitive bicupin YhaK (pirin superfamily)